MAHASDLVVLTTAHSEFEAELLIGALEGYGIHAAAHGGGLADEFAVSQRAMGLGGGVRVMVAQACLEDARVALAQIEEARVLGADDLEEEGTEESETVSWSTVAILFLTVTVFGLGWFILAKLRDTAPEPDPLWEFEWGADRLEQTWRDSGKRAFVFWDKDGDNIHESIWVHDREGRVVSKSFDRNANGVMELTIRMGPDGGELFRSIDANENCVTELEEFLPVDGVVERWLDSDEDGHWDRHEFVRASTGEVLDAFENRGRQGFVRVK